ncbi:pyridoxamine 5'-phosphate oxidase family protein [Rubrimonas cliftonensis]|uniref:Pyridoxamine 5'-phosphate oxidase Alr4036 family FMN-binding domain-containing protein n=1 Tax=Rubrimonas cliftonensis TaxID=89524 RepID=A0A1H4BV85_9RHOB|nr:pyridoxamine 5'-phosphate oxidase family protein [Rubrimonas cliftonensis]SEA52004.1 hypothetical protein SAMN05444370_10658 [Rubrimonas cliftonensis]
MANPPQGPNPRDPQAALDARFYDDLDESLAEAWRLLARGAADRRSAMHVAQLASVGLDGGARLRSVVLRGAERAARRLRVHTDARSTKAEEIAREARVELCAYDPRAKIQVRARGTAVVAADGPEADAAWAGSSPGSRLCYRALPPGAALNAPREGDPTAAMRAAPLEAGRENFRAVLLTVDRVEWLYLAARGHRRAVFDWRGQVRGEGWTGRWVAP